MKKTMRLVLVALALFALLPGVSLADEKATVEQLAEFMRLASTGERTRSQVQAFIEGQNPFVPNTGQREPGLSFREAVGVLGEGRVASCQEAGLAWNTSVPDARVLYSMTTLRRAALLNKQSQHDWRLVCILPLSLKDQRDARGIDLQNQPAFYDNSWWFKYDWATKKPKTNYYLVNMVGRFGEKTYKEQQAKIAKLDHPASRTPIAVFSQAIQTIFMVSGGERIAENWYHRTLEVDSDGHHVHVGSFGSGGLRVYSYWGDGRGSRVRVSLLWKFDF